MTKLRAGGAMLLAPTILLAYLATFAFLVWEDWSRGAAWWQWPLLVPVNSVLATLWPLYWLLLRWVA